MVVIFYFITLPTQESKINPSNDRLENVNLEVIPQQWGIHSKWFLYTLMF